MAHGGGDGARHGTDFNLPDEILSVIPTDPYDQLDLARKITSTAIASRVTNLEAETGTLRRKLDEKDRLIGELESKLNRVEAACRDAELRLKITREDNMELVTERDSLASTAKKLSHDLAKLEMFKRQLKQSLKEESLSQTETVDIGTNDQAMPKHTTSDDSKGYSEQPSYSRSKYSININYDASKQPGQRFSITPYITPRITPTGTPKVIGRTSRTDVKEFFRQARSRLSLEQFNAFLANIKELNAQRQSREETLRKAEGIFGTENTDLYALFQGLIKRNVQ